MYKLTQKKYFKNLDATRALAFFFVFSAHAFVSSDPNVLNSSLFKSINGYGKLGFLGLEYFFVLSSFLITWIAIEEYKQNGYFKLKAFLIRRALRVWPIYFLIVFTAYLAFYFIKYFINYEINELPNILNFIFFIINFYTIDNGTNYLFFLVFLWSISIEEQFYIFWSFILKYCFKYLKHISLLLIVISLIFRWYYSFIEPINNVLYFHTFSALGNFGIGSLIAYISFKRTIFYEYISTFNTYKSLAVYIIFITSLIFYSDIFSNSYMVVFERVFYSLIFGYIIIEQAFNQTIKIQFGRSKYLSFLGKISYGLYCYHGIVITFLVYGLNLFSISENIYSTIFLYPLVIFITTTIISKYSYEYFESWFLRKKKKFY